MNAYMQIRMSKEMKDEFQRIAKENAQNPSQLVRNWIKDYIEENKKEELNKMLKEVDVRVTSDWLKENMEFLYDAILDQAEEFAEDETNTFTHEEFEEMKSEGFEVSISISDYGTHWAVIVYVNDDTSAWFHDNAKTWFKEDLEKILKLGEEDEE